MTRNPPLFLGIDTGGTYTDAVLWAEGPGGQAGEIVAKAKALTPVMISRSEFPARWTVFLRRRASTRRT